MLVNGILRWEIVILEFYFGINVGNLFSSWENLGKIYIDFASVTIKIPNLGNFW